MYTPRPSRWRYCTYSLFASKKKLNRMQCQKVKSVVFDTATLQRDRHNPIMKVTVFNRRLRRVIGTAGRTHCTCLWVMVSKNQVVHQRFSPPTTISYFTVSFARLLVLT